MEKTDICSLNMTELSAEIKNIGEVAYRGRQIYNWLHKKLVWDFDSMTDLPLGLRSRLEQFFFITHGEVKEKLTTNNTCKYLFRLGNNSIIESVVMRHSFGNTVCVSSQAGCNMGCAFCYSTKGGKDRDLSAAEMLYQIYAIEKDIDGRVSGAVIMGSGEPLDNYDNTLKFIEILCSKEGLNLGQRHITLSTCGLAEKIYDLAAEKLQINLALSLHAPNDNLRREIMPVAKSYTVAQVMEACDYYAKETGRRVTYEYALIKGVNDSAALARELGSKLRGRLCHVNLIPVNHVGDGLFCRPDPEVIQNFAGILTNLNINTTIRREMGSSINAACGQLRGGVQNR